LVSDIPAGDGKIASLFYSVLLAVGRGVGAGANYNIGARIPFKSPLLHIYQRIAYILTVVCDGDVPLKVERPVGGIVAIPALVLLLLLLGPGHVIVAHMHSQQLPAPTKPNHSTRREGGGGEVT
jgi:hypothetical protein